MSSGGLLIDGIPIGEAANEETTQPFVTAHAQPAQVQAAAAAQADGSAPRISVVIPTYRRPELMARCLAAVLAQQMDPNAYEIIVVDDGHTDDTRDVVLMDVNMPVLGGIDATRRLRELQRAGRVAPFAIVAATASVDEETEQRCRDAGMDGFLSKPLRLPLMRSELRRVTHQEA